MLWLPCPGTGWSERQQGRLSLPWEVGRSPHILTPSPRLLTGPRHDLVWPRRCPPSPVCCQSSLLLIKRWRLQSSCWDSLASAIWLKGGALGDDPMMGIHGPRTHLLGYKRLHTVLVPFFLLPSTTWVWARGPSSEMEFHVLFLGVPASWTVRITFFSLYMTQSWVFCYSNINGIRHVSNVQQPGLNLHHVYRTNMNTARVILIYM